MSVCVCVCVCVCVRVCEHTVLRASHLFAVHAFNVQHSYDSLHVCVCVAPPPPVIDMLKECTACRNPPTPSCRPLL